MSKGCGSPALLDSGSSPVVGVVVDQSRLAYAAAEHGLVQGGDAEVTLQLLISCTKQCWLRPGNSQTGEFCSKISGEAGH